jgi:GntR family transcriptional regulator/MocR family aminotransferase
MLFAGLRSAGPRGLQRRLYAALRAAILGGTYPAGTRLPATRALAAEAGVARQTVVLVYERLLAEGYLVGRVGSGTYVSASVGAAAGAQRLVPRPGTTTGPPPEQTVPATDGLLPADPPLDASPAGSSETRLGGVPRSAWASRALDAPERLWAAGAERPRFDFRPGVPDWTAFPHITWRRLLARRWRGAEAAPALAQYGDPAGYRPLREALATYLGRSRGVRCDAGQIVVVSGSQQALDLLVRVCLNPGDAAAVENPGYPPARAILSAAGVATHLAPVDREGLQVGALPAAGAGAPRLVYVTPSHQYPTGVTLSLARRLELLEWAAGAGALIVEDDYDSELRYEGPPLPALQGLDDRGCVAYVGSCSSVLFPPLRIGWIVAPPSLVRPLVAAKWLADRQTATLDQLVLADFIADGHFTRHLRRSRRLYAARRRALVAAVGRYLPPSCVLSGEAAGLQTPLDLPPDADEPAVVAAAVAQGVGVEPLAPCYGAPPHASAALTPRDGRRPGLLLGFAAVEEVGIDEGIRRLAAAVSSATSTTSYSRSRWA